MWEWAKKNKPAAAIIAVLLMGALVSAYGAWSFRSDAIMAKKAEKEQARRADTLEKEGEARDAAFRKALGATEPALKSALAGVREAKASLAQAEAARRELWTPPAIDNLAARFDRAVEGLR